jgi:hypothetical protein
VFSTTSTHKQPRNARDEVQRHISHYNPTQVFLPCVSEHPYETYLSCPHLNKKATAHFSVEIYLIALPLGGKHAIASICPAQVSPQLLCRNVYPSRGAHLVPSIVCPPTQTLDKLTHVWHHIIKIHSSPPKSPCQPGHLLVPKPYCKSPVSYLLSTPANQKKDLLLIY